MCAGDFGRLPAMPGIVLFFHRLKSSAGFGASRRSVDCRFADHPAARSVSDVSLPPENFTARAGGWSASHRKAAVLGWLAFVVLAFALGNAAGTVTLKSQDQGNGESRAANQILAQQFPRERAGEVVLVQTSAARLGGAEYRAVVADLVGRLSTLSAVMR